MNKNIKKYILTILLFIAITTPVYAGVDFDAGMRAYNKGDYNFAKVLFQKAIEKNYYDVDSRYMYCQILMKEKNYEQAKNQYQIIIKSAPASLAAKLSKKGIENIEAYNQKIAAKAENTDLKATSSGTKTQTASSSQKSTQKISTEKDYVKNAYRGGKKYTRPLGMTRVYIPKDDIFNPLMKKAYKEWQSAIGSMVMFSFIANPKDANDVVSFVKASNNKGMQQAGNCQYNIEGSSLVGNTITITAYTPDGKPLPKEAVYHAMLHEIGHSIGIMGHSTDSNDIMSQGANHIIAHLSQRDKNTAKLLYRTYGKEPDAEEIKKAKEAELKDIAKRIPNNPNSFIDLGDEAMIQKKYDLAIEYYKKAEAIYADTNVCYRLIKAYNALNDKDNELAYYKKILKINPSDEIAIHNLLVIYQNQLRFEEGQAILKAYIEKNPNSVKRDDIKEFQEIFSDTNIKKMQYRKKLINVSRRYR